MTTNRVFWAQPVFRAQAPIAQPGVAIASGAGSGSQASGAETSAGTSAAVSSTGLAFSQQVCARAWVLPQAFQPGPLAHRLFSHNDLVDHSGRIGGLALPRPPQPHAALWSCAVCAPVWVFRLAVFPPLPQHPRPPQQALARRQSDFRRLSLLSRMIFRVFLNLLVATGLSSTGLAFAPPRVRRRRFGLSSSPALSTAASSAAASSWDPSSWLDSPATASLPPRRRATATATLLRRISLFGGLSSLNHISLIILLTLLVNFFHQSKIH